MNKWPNFTYRLVPLNKRQRNSCAKATKDAQNIVRDKVKGVYLGITRVKSSTDVTIKVKYLYGGVTHVTALRDLRRRTPDKTKGLLKGPMLYIFKSVNDELLYVGKSIQLNSRLSSHFVRGRAVWKDEVSSVYVAKVPESELHIMEAYLIAKHSPKYNEDLLTKTAPTFELREPKFRKIKLDLREDSVHSRFGGYV